MDINDIEMVIDSEEEKKITEIKGMLREILKNEFIIFIRDLCTSLKNNYSVNYSIKNTYTNALNYMISKDPNFLVDKKEEHESLLLLLNKPNYEELFFSKYNNLDAINILQEILVYYLVSFYNKDAFDNITIDNNIYSLIISLLKRININMEMIPKDNMNWIHNAERLLEVKVIDESTEELSSIEIRKEMNRLIENQTVLLAEYRYTSYAICIGVLSYATGKLSN
jgi:hypothetical protein